MTHADAFRSSAPSPSLIPWMLNLAIWVLARSLNMPEPLVHDTGVFVFAQVQAVENQGRQGALPDARCCVSSAPGSR